MMATKTKRPQRTTGPIEGDEPERNDLISELRRRAPDLDSEIAGLGAQLDFASGAAARKALEEAGRTRRAHSKQGGHKGAGSRQQRAREWQDIVKHARSKLLNNEPRLSDSAMAKRMAASQLFSDMLRSSQRPSAESIREYLGKLRRSSP
jgi:hypothetical protein